MLMTFRMRNNIQMSCRAIALGLGLVGTCSAWQVQYDLLGPVLEKTKSHIVQVGHEFDGWGVGLAPEWMEREYSNFNGWVDEETGDVQVRGGGLWASAWMRPFDEPGWRALKLGAYGRWRRFTFAYQDRRDWGSDDFRQNVETWAAGLEGGLTWKIFEHATMEPYTRWGLAHHDRSLTGRASDDLKHSDFRFEWDPDFRMGVMMGVRW